MKKVITPWSASAPRQHACRLIWAAAATLFLCLIAGLSTARAANILTDPGFELGGAAWSMNTWGGTSQLDTAVVHSGVNSWKFNADQTVAGNWNGGRQLALAASDAKFYKYSAWVNVPGATDASPMGWSWRHNLGAGALELGYTKISAPGWTQVKGPYVQLPAGSTAFTYVGFHSMDVQLPFYVDDFSVDESDPLTLNGRVVDSTGTGVDNATVAASSPDWSTAATTTAGGGYYTLSVPAGSYSVAAFTPGLKGSVAVTVSSSPTTAPNIVLATDPDYDPDLVFSLRSSAVGASGGWPAAFPAGDSLARMGGPTVETIRGQQWEKNSYTSGDGWRFTSAAGTSIPCNGATIVAVVKHRQSVDSWWSSIVNCFYNSLMLNVRNQDGRVQLVINDWPGNGDYDGPTLADGQEAVISGVVQPDGTLMIYKNGVGTALTKAATSFTEIKAGGTGAFSYGQNINVGRNDPDGWTTFNGSLGDIYFYKVALSDTKRAALEQALMTKFGITNTVYTMSASVDGPGGRIDPAGPAIGVPEGIDKTFTITPWDAHWAVKSVIVDGVDVGPVSTYTFKDVRANGHTIVVSFVQRPTAVVSGRVTDGTNGIMGATVYFKSANSANRDFSTSTTTYDGQYNIRLLQGTWNVSASALYHNSSAVVPLVLGVAPATLDFTLTTQPSTQQPMLVSKGAGAAAAAGAYTAGFTFTTGPNAIDVTQLGFVDWEGDGLVAEHSVGIWQDVDMITSATVPAGTAGTKIGDFRYAAANPAVTLLPNTTYTLAADVAGTDKWPDAAANPGFNVPDFSGLSGVNAVRADGPLTRPTVTFGAAGDVFAAANLIGKMAAPPTIKVTGTVKDAYGVGINNAVVQIGGTTGPAAVSDANGKYVFYDVPIGAGQEVYADALGFADKLDTVDTTNAATTPVVKDMTLTGKVETGVIQNGGFENGLAPWALNYGDQMVGTTRVDKYSGEYAGFWTAMVPVWYNGYLSIRVPTVPDSTYNVYFKLKTDAAVGQCGFSFNVDSPWWGYAGGLSPGSNWMYTTVPGKWEQALYYRSWDDSNHTVGVRMTPPAGTTFIQIICGLGADAVGQTLYVDDVVVDRVGPDVAGAPYTIFDVVNALRWAGGLDAVPQNTLTRYDVVTDGKINVADALRLSRKVAGVDTNP